MPAPLWPAVLALRELGRERAALAVFVPAWLLLAISTQTALLPSLCMGSARSMDVLWTAWEVALSSGALVRETVAAAIMIVALMGPLVIAPLRHVLCSQFSDNRIVPSAVFLAAYAFSWMLASAALLVPVMLLHFAGGRALQWSAVAALLIAGGWQLTAFKAASMRRCHRRPPLSPWGAVSVRDAGVFGLRHAVACIGTCWAMMLAVMLSGHHLVAAAAITALALMERGSPLIWLRRNGWILTAMAAAECTLALQAG
jgi:predicted metal-binding membrane protein